MYLHFGRIRSILGRIRQLRFTSVGCIAFTKVSSEIINCCAQYKKINL